MGEAEMAMLREIYADWGRGDYSRTDYLPAEFELVFGSDFLEEGTFRGRAAVGKGWGRWLSQWSSWQARPSEYIPLGDRVLVLLDARGVAKASGVQLAQPSANLWEFRDGRPSRLTLYTRASTALREAGVDSP
jgi:ketosteroid isomerase-like protein